MANIPEGFEVETTLAIPEGFQVENQEARGGGGLVPSLFYGAQGQLGGLASVLGAPVDIVNLAVGAKRPFLGSEDIKARLGAATQALSRATGVGAPGTSYMYQNIQEVPPEYRPSARAGEAVGATVPFLGAVSLAARGIGPGAALARAALAPTGTGLGSAAAAASRQLTAEVASNPQFLISQIPSTLGAAAGAYGAEVVAPGSELGQIAGQFGGGLLGSAAALGAQGAGREIARLRQVVTPTSEEATKAAAGREIAPLLAAAGETPEQVIASLRQRGAVPGTLAGERAQSRAVTGVQDFLASRDAELANAVKLSKESVQATIKQTLEEGFAPGTPQALIEAAARRRASFNTSLDNLVNAAEARAQNAVARAETSAAETVSTAQQMAERLGGAAQVAAAPVTPLTPAQARGVNIQARNIIEQALTDARAYERELWNKVPKGVEVRPTNAVAAYDEMRANMVPEDRMPDIIDRVMRRYKASIQEPEVGISPIEAEARAFQRARAGEAAAEPITVGELQSLRSRLLAEQRDLRAQQNWNDARRVGAIADALLEDMTVAGDDAAQTAREFSRALNDRFSRSFAGDVLGTKPSGAERVRPELTLEAAATGAPERVAAQLRELQTAAGAEATQMQALQEQFLRSMTQQVMDPVTGAVRPDAAARFIRDNAAILEMFPQYRTQLQQAAQTQRVATEATREVPAIERAAQRTVQTAQRDADKAVRDVLAKTGDAAKQAEKRSAFGRVLAAGEDPATAVAAAINSNTPVRDMNKLAALAQRGGAEAVGGLRASIMSHVMDNAKVSGKFSYGRAYELLFEPLSPNGPSLLKSMQNNKLINADQAKQIADSIANGIKTEISDLSGIEVKEFGKQAGMIGRYIPRIIGAKLSSFISGPGAGESLQIAQMAANVGERIASKLPADRVNTLMSKALMSESPDDLIDILEYAARYTGPRGQQIVEPFTREVLSALRAMTPRTTYEPERKERGVYGPSELGLR